MSIINLKFIKKRISSLSDLLLSNVLSNIILFFGMYIITRIISPSEFGKYSLFFSIALTAQSIFTLRYEQAIAAAIMDRAASMLLLFCLIFNFGFTLIGLMLTCIIIYIVNISYFVKDEITNMIFMIWPACFALALYSTAQAMALRTGDLRKIAVSRIVRAAMSVSFQVSLILFVSGSAYSMIVGESLANVIISIIMFVCVKSNLPKILLLLKEINGIYIVYKNIISALKKFRVFALIGLPHAFMHASAAALFNLAIGAFYGSEALGQYSLMRRMIFGVTALFSNAAYQLGVSEASAAKGDRARFVELYKYVIAVIGFISIPSAALMLIWGEAVFSIVFGNEWGSAGELATMAFLLIALEPIASAIAFIPLFLKRQPAAFAWSIGQNVAGLASLILIFAAGGGMGAAILGSSLMVGTVLIAYLTWLFRLCSRQAHATREALST